VQIEMELALPKVSLGFFVAGPALNPAEAPTQLQPIGFALSDAVPRMRVDPMLKRINGRHPRQQIHNPLQVLARRTLRFLGRVEDRQIRF
jgi:hypothetical protein